MKHIVRIFLITPVALLLIAAAVLALTPPKSPPPIAAIQNAAGTMAKFAMAQPAPRYLKARDGALLSYRLYPGRKGGGVTIAVHGSSGNTVAMHGVAEALAQRGITVYSVDLRGHGLSKGPAGQLGDVVFRGQYESDLADFAAYVKHAHPGERRLLLGHSMGGATILRTAGMQPFANNYDAYLALSPFIEPGGKMDRPNQGGWTSVSVPRIVVLSILNGFGISDLDHMTVLAMAVPADDDGMRPRTYSHALLSSADLPRDWKPTIAAIRAPTRILIGANDELFVAQAYPGAIGAVNPRIAVSVLPGGTHMGMVSQKQALAIVAENAQQLLTAERHQSGE